METADLSCEDLILVDGKLRLCGIEKEIIP